MCRYRQSLFQTTLSLSHPPRHFVFFGTLHFVISVIMGDLAISFLSTIDVISSFKTPPLLYKHERYPPRDWTLMTQSLPDLYITVTELPMWYSCRQVVYRSVFGSNLVPARKLNTLLPLESQVRSHSAGIAAGFEKFWRWLATPGSQARIYSQPPTACY